MVLSSEGKKQLAYISSLPVSQGNEYKIALCEKNSDLYVDESLLVYFLKDADPFVKWYAIKAVGDRRISEAKDTLVEILTQRNIFLDKTSLHAIAAYSIGKLGNICIEQLLPLLKHEDESTVIAAIDSLGEISSPITVRQLSEFLKNPYTKRSCYAALALGKIGEASVSVLYELSKSCDENTLFVIIDALMMIDCVASYKCILNISASNPADIRKVLLSHTNNSTEFVKRINCSYGVLHNDPVLSNKLSNVVNQLMKG